MLQTKKIEYKDGETLLEGYCAYDDAIPGKKPAVLVVHDWSGRNDFACQKAEILAELGYVGFAVDMYGKGKIGKDKEEKSSFMNPLIQDRNIIRRRMLAGMNAVKQLETVNTAKIGVIGFCFGGLCGLELARSGEDFRGVVSFHGALAAADNLPNQKILAKLLIIHGYDDPLVKQSDVAAFENEMTNQKVDWQLLVYSNTMHGFTNPLANDPGFGTVFSPSADKRSWNAMKTFFAEVLN